MGWEHAGVCCCTAVTCVHRGGGVKVGVGAEVIRGSGEPHCRRRGGQGLLSLLGSVSDEEHGMLHATLLTKTSWAGCVGLTVSC